MLQKRIKILSLSPRYSFPPDDGGKIGIANTIKYLNFHGGEITNFFYANSMPDDSLLDLAKPFCKPIPFVQSLDNTIGKALKSIFTMQSVFLMKHYSDAAFNFLCDLQEKERFDIIHCDHTSMAVLGLKLKEKFGLPVGLRLHNIEYRIWELYGKELPAHNPLKYYISHQASLLKKREKQICEQVDICFAVSDDERNKARRLAPNAKVLTSGPGVDFDFWKRDESAETQPHTMLLATTYRWIHNVDGLVWFINNVLPQIKQEMPQARLKLLGKDAPAILNDFKELGVEVVGYVDDVLPYFNSAGIYIAPLFVGAGIRIKILEAMAMGLPVVATKVSADGIDATQDDGLFVTDDPNETARIIINLMKQPDYAQKVGANAQEFIKANFSWEQNVKVMFDEYIKLTANG